MWNDQSVAGAGFFNSPNQFGNANTPNAAQKPTGRRAAHTAPIVITQALHCGDDGIMIWGTEIQIVYIVARVRNIQMQSTKITYTIQDLTGRMRAVLWLSQDEDMSIPKVKVNDYIQIFGNLKSNMGKKILMVFRIIPITDVNAITSHYLHCINNRLTMEAEWKKKKTMVNTTASVVNPGLPANSLVGVSENNGLVNEMNHRQMMVYKLIRASTLEQGISKQDMYNTLKDHMIQNELDNILEWMCGEGHIYSTIDEEHFRATDAF